MTHKYDDDTAGSRTVEGQSAKGVLWVTAEMIGVQGTSFVVFAVMAHYVQPRDFGLISICYFAIQSLEMLILYNIATVAFRRQKVVAVEFTTAFWITMGMAVLLCIALLASAQPAETLFHAPGLADILQAMSGILLFIGLSRTHEAWLIRHFQYKSMSLRGIAGAVVGGIAGVLLAIHGFGVEALVGQQLVTSMVSTTLLWMVCPWRPGFEFSIPAARRILSFMLRMLPNDCVNAINQNCDTFLVAFCFGPASAGLYNVGKRVKLALQLMAGTPISAIGLPALAELQNNPTRLRAGVLRSLTVISAICCPIFLGASAVAPDAIIVLFGPHWTAAIPIMQLLSFSGLALVFMTFADNVFVLKDRTVWCLWVCVSYALLAVIALLILSRLHSSLLALPFVLPFAVVFPLSMRLMARLIGLPLRRLVIAIIPGFSAGLVMFAGVLWVAAHLAAEPAIIRLALLCGFGIISYILALVLLSRNTASLLLEMLTHIGRRDVEVTASPRAVSPRSPPQQRQAPGRAPGARR